MRAAQNRALSVYQLGVVELTHELNTRAQNAGHKRICAPTTAPCSPWSVPAAESNPSCSIQCPSWITSWRVTKSRCKTQQSQHRSTCAVGAVLAGESGALLPAHMPC